MCGIAGIVSLGGTAPDPEALRGMVRAVAHRGPDGEGFAFRGPVALGHRRLAIVDLSDAGLQPMQSADGTLSITFNGEIYNYVELRDELRELGHAFRTASDTEVLLAAYRQWGPRCVDRLNGMWAFAIHDAGTGTVFCSRDRFGVKPFYYARLPGSVAFGSEIRQLLPLLPAVRADRDVVRDFLFMGIDEPVERSFFEGVRKLPGGHSMTIDLASGEVRVRREYRIADRGELANLAPQQAADVYGACLEDSVRLRLRSDVPVGTCLSGGLDSSSVAALAAGPYRERRGERFRAITAISEEAANDETPFARAVAEWSSLEWITVRPTYEDFASTLADVVRTQEEPFGGPSICMQWFVMREARRNGIPVMLDGQGGDETLLGYRRYFAAFMLSQWRAHGLLRMLREMWACRREGAQLGTLAIVAGILFQGFPRMAWAKMRLRARWMRRPPGMNEHLRAEARAMRDLGSVQRLDIERSNLPALVVTLAKRLPQEVTGRRWKIGVEAPASTWMSRHAGQMQRAVESSAILGEFARPGWLARNYGSMHAGTRWRLFSVAIWEREFGVR